MILLFQYPRYKSNSAIGFIDCAHGGEAFRNYFNFLGRFLTMSEELVKIGDVIHYYTNVEVAVVELTGKLKVGDRIMIKGATTDFTQLVKSIQIDHDQVTEAKSGDSIGLEVEYRVREGDKVFRS